MNRLTRAWRSLTRNRVTDVLTIHDQRERDEQIIRNEIRQAGERLYSGDHGHCPDCTIRVRGNRLTVEPCGRDHRTAWPPDLCAYPPCDPEDGYVCTSCAPRGRHHRRVPVHTPPSDDPPTDVISIAEWQARTP